MRAYYIIPATMVALSITLSGCGKQEEEKKIEKEQALQQNDQAQLLQRRSSFIDALNQRTIDTLVNLWAEEAIYRNPANGELVQGKDAIRKEYRDLFSRLKGASLELQLQTIDYPYSDKAVEKGIARLQRPGQPPVESAYQMTYVKKNGQWYLLNISKMDFGLLNNVTARRI